MQAPAYILAWGKENGEVMWDRAEDDGEGNFIIRNVQPSDAGTYICTGSNFYSIDSDVGTLIVGGKWDEISHELFHCKL